MSDEQKIKVVPQEEGTAEVRICSPQRHHVDDLEGECQECKCPIFYRPHPPFLCKFLCLDCAMPLLTAKDADIRCSTEAAATAIKLGFKFRVEEARKERCTKCGEEVAEWLDPDWSRGRICIPCYNKLRPSDEWV